MANPQEPCLSTHPCFNPSNLPAKVTIISWEWGATDRKGTACTFCPLPRTMSQDESCWRIWVIETSKTMRAHSFGYLSLLKNWCFVRVVDDWIASRRVDPVSSFLGIQECLRVVHNGQVVESSLMTVRIAIRTTICLSGLKHRYGLVTRSAWPNQSWQRIFVGIRSVQAPPSPLSVGLNL